MRKFAFLSLALLCAAACNKAGINSESTAIRVNAAIRETQTKVAYDGAKAAFEAGDKLSLFAWTGDNTAIPEDLVVDNVINTLDADGLWTPQEQMLWADMVSPHYFMAVSPAREVTSFTADPYTLDPAAAKYQENDLLIAVNDAGIKANNNPVQLTFDHALAKLNVNLTFRNQWTEGNPPATPNTEAKVDTLELVAYNKATINYITKTLTATGEDCVLGMNRVANASWTTLMIPQTGFRSITIQLKGNDEWLGGNGTYQFTAPEDIKLESGKVTTVNLIIGRDQITLDEAGVTIADWADGEVIDNGEAQTTDGGQATMPLTMECLTDGTIKVGMTGTLSTGMKYAVNGGDKTTITTATTIEGLKKGDKVQFYGNGTDTQAYGDNPTVKLAGGTAEVKVYGNIMSLLDEENFATKEDMPNKEWIFYSLFSGNDKLKDAAGLLLPATTLEGKCYHGMFDGCKALTAAPVLPATTLADLCYYGMFSGCTALTAAPELPATALAYGCYQSMFEGCKALTAAPELPATTLADNCYFEMFSNCSALTAAPELPATTLASSCYQSMFYGCKALTAAPELLATTLADDCYHSMFYGCGALTAAPELPATTMKSNCYTSMFSNCSALTAAPELPATTLGSSCYENMFYGCAALTTAPALPATTLEGACYSGMFQMCTALTAAPVLPATALTSYCYENMFKGCANLASVTCLATSIPAAQNCTTTWLSGVAASGTFTTPSGTNWQVGSASGIPSGWTRQNWVPAE